MSLLKRVNLIVFKILFHFHWKFIRFLFVIPNNKKRFFCSQRKIKIKLIFKLNYCLIYFL